MINNLHRINLMDGMVIKPIMLTSRRIRMDWGLQISFRLC